MNLLTIILFVGAALASIDEAPLEDHGSNLSITVSIQSKTHTTAKSTRSPSTSSRAQTKTLGTTNPSTTSSSVLYVPATYVTPSTAHSSTLPNVITVPTTITPPTHTTSTTTTLVESPTTVTTSTIPPSHLQLCYDKQPLDFAQCAVTLDTITNCFNGLRPWIDPYNTTQSEAFRDCTCEIKPGQPFSPVTNNAYEWWSSCTYCLVLALGEKQSAIYQQMLYLESFCRSQQPDAYLYVSQLSAFFGELDSGQTLTSPPLLSVTPMVSILSALYTTTPPLANLAYGASAAGDGSLAGVTPSLITYTNGTDTITSLVTWIPTAVGATTYDATKAAKSAESVASSALSASFKVEPTRCLGRGPCKNAGARQKVRSSSVVLGVVAVVVGALMLVF